MIDNIYITTQKQQTIVAIDSDGAVFNTALIKQKRFFHPAIIKYWHLERIAEVVIETAEFVNLYSQSRGSNRFVALLKLIELLNNRTEIIKENIKLPNIISLKEYIDSNVPLCNNTLEERIALTNDDFLKTIYAWSKEIDSQIAEKMGLIPPFEGVQECLEKMKDSSTLIVSSQSPFKALKNEWQENKLDKYISYIASQEMGSKIEHLNNIIKQNNIPSKNLLMIGDAPADYNAAKTVGALFFPIIPTKEISSWKKLHNESYDIFLNNNYNNAYQQKLIEEFFSFLPDKPVWI